jgi:hypothetical protein
MQNTAQFSDGILVNRVGTVYERVEIVASPPVHIHGWLTLAALHKIVPLLWVCGAVLQKSLNQVSNIRSCTVAGHMTYPNTHGQLLNQGPPVLPAAEVQRLSRRTIFPTIREPRCECRFYERQQAIIRARASLLTNT